MPASASPVIGRDRELESLRQFLDAVPEGPVALLIEGEAGIGKTALWRQAVDLGRQRSYRVLTCRPADSETRLSFSALDDPSPAARRLLTRSLDTATAPRRAVGEGQL
jgi:predicted ATPase